MDVRNVDILSEGEFRALALACFLADIKSLPHHSGIIVDDPVSSLDHLRCTRVANRLVEEAKHRQVIIFTHDLCFYHDIVAKAAEEGIGVLPVLIRRTEKEGFGVVADKEEPWLVKKVGPRLQALDERINHIRDMPDKTGEPYRLAMRAFYSDLRDAYERFVEEVLFGQVISRFQKEVKTLSLHSAFVDDDDYKVVYFGMKRASNFCHDRPAAQQVVWPTHDEMRTEVKTFREHVTKATDRNKQLAKDREALQKAKLPATA
jgi:energy-coupling factor transporter ATP-binding protein EcfA2